jgi:hypothetical protein
MKKEKVEVEVETEPQNESIRTFSLAILNQKPTPEVANNLTNTK